MKPIKFGKMQTVNMETGEVTSAREVAFTLLPAAPGTCLECAVSHTPEAPHDQQSLFYQMRFHAQHSRWPTWTDAMAHCSPTVRALWRKGLMKKMHAYGLDIPEDLRESNSSSS